MAQIKNSVWKSVDEYVDFAIANQVFGGDAVKLREQQLKVIPLPRINVKNKLHSSDSRTDDERTQSRGSVGKKKIT